MLTVSIGESEKVLERVRATTLEFREKHPNAPLLRFDAEEVTGNQMRELAASASLIGEPSLVVVRGPLEAAADPLELIALAPSLARSKNFFHIADETLSAKTLKELKAAGATIADEGGTVREAPRRFTAFPFADAVLSRDRAKAWMFYLDCLKEGLIIEEIHGTLVWQVKNVLLIMREGANPGLAPFVYSKGKRFASLWEPDELEAFLAELVVLYHEAHRGTLDFETALERLLLERLDRKSVV